MGRKDLAQEKESEYEEIANRAIREIKNITDLFIDTLNNESARMALREKIRDSLLNRAKGGPLVPNTDGTHPAYIIDVYSSEIDLSQAIVRADVAGRPVRALDYIHATVTVNV
jgi:hypothetical protein